MVDSLALEQQVCFALAVTNRAVLAVYRPQLPRGQQHLQHGRHHAGVRRPPLAQDPPALNGEARDAGHAGTRVKETAGHAGTRVKESAGQAGQRVKVTAGQAGEKAKQVPGAVKDLPELSKRNPKVTAAVGGALALAVAAVAWLVRRRK